MIFETARLLLRPWREEDAEDLYMYAKDPDVGTPAGWPPHTDVEHSLAVIRTVFAEPETYAVCLKENDRPIGSIGFHRNDLATQDDEYELGYWIGKNFGGSGMIPEAARTLLRYAFGNLGMNRIWCGYYEGNTQSKRVQEKLGFVFHHKTEGIDVALLQDVRTGYANIMTKARWQSVELFLRQKETLDTFRQTNAITQAQFDKSFGDLQSLMGMHGVA